MIRALPHLARYIARAIGAFLRSTAKNVIPRARAEMRVSALATPGGTAKLMRHGT